MSLIVGIAVAAIARRLGIVIGLVAGYFRWLDGIVMRVMDGLMAIPAILLAIALVAIWRASLLTVIVAIAVPEIPRVVRLVRSLVLSVREEPYVEAAISLGTPTWILMFRHILPNTVAPLIVQGTYICAVGDPGRGDPVASSASACRRRSPTWGNIMAEGRMLFRVYPAQHPVSRHVPRAHRARRQHAGRRPARHARSEDERSDAIHERSHDEAPMQLKPSRRAGPRRSAGPQSISAARRAPIASRRRERELHGRRRRDRLPGGRIGLGQVGDRATPSWACCAKALKPSSPARSCWGENMLAAGETRLRELRGTRMAMIFQEPMTALNPVMTCGEQIDEVLATHTGSTPPQRRAKIIAHLRAA